MAIPKPFIQTSPTNIQYRAGGGCISIFGLPFLAAGLFVLGLIFNLVPVKNYEELPNMARLIMGLMGVVFSCVGGGLLLGRRWVTIDKLKRQIVDEYGLLIPMRRKETSLSNYQKVSLSFDRGDSDTADRYPVKLSGSDDVTLSLTSPQTYKEAIEQAEFLSTFLHLPVEDSSTGNTVLTKAEDLHTPFYKQKQETETTDGTTSPAEIMPLPARPMSMGSKVEETSSSLAITILSDGASLFHLFLPFIVPVIVFFAFFGRGFTKDTFKLDNPETSIQFFFIGFFLLFFVLVPVVQVIKRYNRSKTAMWKATITRQGLSIEDNTTSGENAKHEIALKDIISIETHVLAATPEQLGGIQSKRIKGHLVRLMQARNSLTIKTNDNLLVFMLGLPHEELVYLRALMMRKIAALATRWG